MKEDNEREPNAMSPPGVEKNTSAELSAESARRRPAKGTEKDVAVSPTMSQYAKRESRVRCQKTCDDVMLLVKIFVALGLAGAWIGLTAWRLTVLRNEAVAAQAPVIIWKPSANDSSKPDCTFTYDPAYGDYARLEQPWNKPYIGFSIDWSKDTAKDIEDRLKHRPMMIGTWIHIDNVTWEKDMIAWYASELKKQAQNAGKRISTSMLQIALMPDVALEQIPDSLLQGFAKQMADVNYVFGVPVMLRFGMSAYEVSPNVTGLVSHTFPY